MSETKAFSTLAVAGTYTGRLLEERGFDKIQEVMDHLFPGIMTIGCAAMQPKASELIAKEHPELAAMGEVGTDWEAYAARVLKILGPTLTVTGPANVSESCIKEAYDAFMTKG